MIPGSPDEKLRPPVWSGDERPPSHLYRVMSSEEFEQARERGFIQSDERQNIESDEGTVFSLVPTGGFYSPRTGDKGVIVRVNYSDDDGWVVGPEGPRYVKTSQEIPFERVDAYQEFLVDNDSGSGALSLPDPDKDGDGDSNSPIPPWEPGRIAPTHTKKLEDIHERESRSSTRLVNATTMEGMPEDITKRLTKVFDLLGISEAELDANIEKILLQAMALAGEGNDPRGLNWYEEAKELAQRIAEEYDIPYTSVIGIIAATSPRESWNSNTALAEYIVRAFKRDHEVQIDDLISTRVERVAEDRSKNRVSLYELARRSASRNIDGRYRVMPDPEDLRGVRLSELDPYIAGLLIKSHALMGYDVEGISGLRPDGSYVNENGKSLTGFNTEKDALAPVSYNSGVFGLGRSMSIGRYGNPDYSLNGHKVRSFFNNIAGWIASRGHSSDVTIDSHALAIALGNEKVSSSSPEYEIFGNMESKPYGLMGYYAPIADAYRRVAEKYGLEPRQVQAITWVLWRELHGEKEGDGGSESSGGALSISDVDRISEGAITVPGKWPQRSAAEVPTEWLKQFRQFDRAQRPLDPDDYAALRQSIIDEGFNDPLILEVGLNGRATLGEGNHRLAIALELGLENVPVRTFVLSNVTYFGRYGSESPDIEVSPAAGRGYSLTPYESIIGVPPAKIDTPNLDRIARRDIRSTEAPSAPQDIVQDLSNEIQTTGIQWTLPSERLDQISEDSRLFAEISYRQGLDKPPVRVPEAEFRDLVSDTNDYTVLYRGIKDTLERASSEMAKEFIEGDLFIGSGLWGNGTYMSTNKELASLYARGSVEPVVIKTVIPNNARFLIWGSEEFDRLVEQFESQYGVLDFAQFLAAKGYDAFVDLPSGVWLVLNRSVIIASDAPPEVYYG
jgi:hypothetical protein